MSQILVVDDEPQIRRTLSTNLRARGFAIDLAQTGEEALLLANQNPPDLVILDLELSGIDGVEVIKRLRSWTPVPIVVLSHQGARTAKRTALDSGADDYVNKPFGMDELLARVRAALHQIAKLDTGKESVINAGDLRIDLLARRVFRADREVDVTPTQWHLIEILAQRQGRLVTYAQLAQEAWGPSSGSAEDHLRVDLAQIRRKLEPAPSRPTYFLTEPGLGYRFVFPVP